MDIQMSAAELQKGLSRAQGIVDRKATLPILANVLLEAEGGSVRLAATDLELALRDEHPAEVKREGRITVPAKNLLEIVRSLPDDTLTLSRGKNDWVEIRSGRAQFRIVGSSADDFPALPEEGDISFVDVPAGVLTEMVEKTRYAVSTDETRYNLNGVFVESVDGRTRMVATDGHRLALIARDLGGDFGLKDGVIIPRKGLDEMRRLLGEKPGTVALGFSANSAVFKTEGLVLIMRLVDGQFPDYAQVIPEAVEHPLTVSREGLLSTLRRVSIVAADRAPAVKLVLAPSVLTVVSENPDLGEAREDLEVAYDGGEITVGFNARYLIDVLAVLDSEEVALELTDELSPGVIRPVGDDGYTAVVMPMRI
ncbi:MAG: DNA polymerase III subunit beta [Deltaproteobacteria bacterium]|nr:MAG: DNA polymerase III subunit beta [Deltaproteobacteria bacterium]